jgi:HAMP domain-containing protein
MARLPAVLTVAVQDDWTTILTAIGTVAAAIAAVGIAIWSNRKTRQRVDAEHTFGQGQLDRQLEASRQQLAAEQAFSRGQLDEEHEAAQELEQLAEAALVEVALAMRDVPLKTDKIYDEPAGQVQKRLGVMVVNHGHYAITRVEAQFSFQGNDLRAAVRSSRVHGIVSPFPQQGGYTWQPVSDQMASTTLQPWDRGMLVEAPDTDPSFVTSPHAIVRWTDRWGTRWEYKHGSARHINDEAQWQA